MPSIPEIIEEISGIRKFDKATERMRMKLSLPPQNTIAMEDLQFLEVPFLKPTANNPRVRKASETPAHIEDQLWPF